MNRLFALLMFLIISGSAAISQTCTISGAGTILWNAPTTPTCIEGGQTTANSSTLIIPVGVILQFDDIADTWTGTKIEVFGQLSITADVTINASIVVKDGGLVTLDKKLSLGTSPSDPTGCNYAMSINTGGLVDVGTTGTDRLYICGSYIMTGSGACNDCGGTNSGTCAYIPGTPYCEPAGGFAGPLGYSKDGYDASLPIELLFFKATKNVDKISLSWATASELNFDYFDVEKSSDGSNFHSIAHVKGNGTTNIRQDYSLDDEKPLLGKNYYRLKSVDFDGYTEYFNVVMVDFDGKMDFSVYPNPSDGVTFSAETNFIPQSRAFVVVYTTLGSEVARFEMPGNSVAVSMPVKLESGVYYARYISGEFTSTSRVLVK